LLKGVILRHLVRFGLLGFVWQRFVIVIFEDPVFFVMKRLLARQMI
jgi:hypothetical protein